MTITGITNVKSRFRKNRHRIKTVHPKSGKATGSIMYNTWATHNAKFSITASEIVLYTVMTSETVGKVHALWLTRSSSADSRRHRKWKHDTCRWKSGRQLWTLPWPLRRRALLTRQSSECLGNEVRMVGNHVFPTAGFHNVSCMTKNSKLGQFNDQRLKKTREKLKFEFNTLAKHQG